MFLFGEYIHTRRNSTIGHQKPMMNCMCSSQIVKPNNVDVKISTTPVLLYMLTFLQNMCI